MMPNKQPAAQQSLKQAMQSAWRTWPSMSFTDGGVIDTGAGGSGGALGSSDMGEVRRGTCGGWFS